MFTKCLALRSSVGRDLYTISFILLELYTLMGIFNWLKFIVLRMREVIGMMYILNNLISINSEFSILSNITGISGIYGI